MLYIKYYKLKLVAQTLLYFAAHYFISHCDLVITGLHISFIHISYTFHLVKVLVTRLLVDIFLSVLYFMP